MHERPALIPRKHCRIDLLTHIFPVSQDHATPGAPQRLVGGRGHHVRIGQRARVDARCDQPREMGHIHHQVGADGIRDSPKAGKIDGPGIGRTSADDEFRLVLMSQLLDLVEIDDVRFLVNTIRNDVEPLAGDICL